MRMIMAVAVGLMSALPAMAEDFVLTSSAMQEGAQLNAEQVFAGFGCEGGNRSPDLAWSGAPEGAKSFALTAYDPDAPTGSGWWHWGVVNIPAATEEFQAGASGAMPEGVLELVNDYGTTGFGGACPPPGEVHRYVFTLHALGVDQLELSPKVSNALAGFMIHANSIASASLTAVYTR